MMVPDNDIIFQEGPDPLAPSGSVHDQMDEKSVDHEAIKLCAEL